MKRLTPEQFEEYDNVIFDALVSHVKEAYDEIDKLRETLSPFRTVVADFEVGSEDWERAARVYYETEPK